MLSASPIDYQAIHGENDPDTLWRDHPGVVIAAKKEAASTGSGGGIGIWSS